MPAIVAMSALGIGFDYPHVRNGRAGGEGALAESTVLLSAAWEPRSEGRPSADADSISLFLTQQHCSRGVMNPASDDTTERATTYGTRHRK
ncbi:hypothetical protein O9K51_10775 [Purpureocillium lavendulum]|uniref:Uncharacterized protein n=1 Tax=Purpureocillium lavendulum TaxID=1247861 RepID=A0AB34FCD5_9HYPO|nr:hypothetical protein O9K51_10775 [Purpureocillium lavendulum]